MATHVPSSPDPVNANRSAPSWLRTAVRRKGLTVSVAAAVALLGAAIALLLPDRYTAEVMVLPPQPNGSAGATAGADALSIRNPNGQQIALLKSRMVEEALVTRFHLQTANRKGNMSSARNRWEERASADSGLQDGLIRLTVTDSDPRRAAEMANAWVDEYRRFTAGLGANEASQRRLFDEQQLEGAHEDLARAEAALEQTEQRTGVSDVEGHDRGMIASAAVLRGQLAAKQMEMEAMREVEYRERIRELLMREYEGASVDEARQGALMQVVEPAVPPDRPSRYRLWILIAALTLAVPLGVAAALLGETASVLRRLRNCSPSWLDALEHFMAGVRQ